MDTKTIQFMGHPLALKLTCHVIRIDRDHQVDNEFLKNCRECFAVKYFQSDALRQESNTTQRRPNIGKKRPAFKPRKSLDRFDGIVLRDLRQDINGTIQELLTSLKFRAKGQSMHIHNQRTIVPYRIKTQISGGIQILFLEVADARAWMIHQITAHQVMPITKTSRLLPVGDKEQSRIFDPSGGQDAKLGTNIGTRALDGANLKSGESATCIVNVDMHDRRVGKRTNVVRLQRPKFVGQIHDFGMIQTRPCKLPKERRQSCSIERWPLDIRSDQFPQLFVILI